MRTLHTIATSVQTGRLYPTVVVKVLVEAENAGGPGA